MQSQTHKISIIMAARDTAEYLPACLESITKQTYKNWELIAVNDHSVDATPEIIQEYANKDQRVRLIHSEREKLIPALKEGYAFANGDLINRMDSDDIMPEYKLEVMLEQWEKYGKGTVVAGGTQHFVDQGEVGEGFKKYDQWLNDIAKNNSYSENTYKECVIPSHCWLIHKDDLNHVDAFNPEVYPEDYDLCFRFYQAGLKIVGLDRVLHYWRDRSDRISRTWDCYKDNRYFELKLKYFLLIDRDTSRPLVLWGAGKNGKDLAKHLINSKQHFEWVCDNENKIGHNVYEQILKHHNFVKELTKPQIIISVASDVDRNNILDLLSKWNKKVIADFWFFI